MRILLFLLFFASSTTQAQSILRPDYPGKNIDVTEELNCLFMNDNCAPQKDQSKQIILGEGEWTINGTVTLKKRDQLVLEPGASVVRNTCFIKGKPNTAPLFNLCGEYASIVGSVSNEIKTNCNNLTEGIIKIGHPDNRTKGAIKYCKVSNVTLAGPQPKSDTKPTKHSLTGIFLYNNQHEPTNRYASQSTNYFHTLSDLVIQQTSIGIHVYNSNACTIHNIVFNRVGQQGGTAFLLEGSQENKIMNIHHHHSLNANSLVFRDSQNAEKTVYNSILNYVIEIGGRGQGYGMVIDIPSDDFYHNLISLSCNHPKAIHYPQLSKNWSDNKKRRTYFRKANRNLLLDYSMYVMFNQDTLGN